MNYKAIDAVSLEFTTNATEKLLIYVLTSGLYMAAMYVCFE